MKNNWLSKPFHPAFPKFSNELALLALVVLLALFTRFYDLEARVMSHDESLHTYFSWLLYRGQGYQHSPMMHGPFQFHALALSYFLFGVSDFTARIPAALFSVATVWMVWYWRRYLGRWGALIAGFLLVISPYMLYYGRYVRNEAFVGLSGIVMLYAMLRHLEVGGKKYLLLLAAALALHFTSKETAFIYVAEALIYLAVYFVAKVTREPWRAARDDYRAFIVSMAAAMLLIAATIAYAMYARGSSVIGGTETAMPSNPQSAPAHEIAGAASSLSPTLFIGLAALLALAAAAFFLIRGYGWERIRNERSFDLLMVNGVIVLPQLSPFPVKLLEGWLKVSIPSTAPEALALANDERALAVIAGFLIFMFILSAVAGLLWNKDKFWQVALVFWIPFTVFYTTFFTNSVGFFTGVVGSLGYWLAQQSVERGSQPWYYYILVQIPIYEFLPALGLLLALILGLTRKPAPAAEAGESAYVLDEESSAGDEEILEMIAEEDADPEERNFSNTFSLLTWWSLINVVAFSLAGEKMPWLTYHLTLPMILVAGWALGRVIDATDWERLKERRVLLAVAALIVFLISVAGMAFSLGGGAPPFQGRELAQLQATAAFLLPTFVALLSAAGLTYLLRDWTLREIARVLVLVFFGLLAVLTMRASFRAAYITYDEAREFLVYAHGAPGVKKVIAQAKEISERTTGGMGIALAYDASAPDTGVSWPFVWYLRDFTNQRSFDQPTRALRESVFVIVDEKNFDKIEGALGPGYYRMDYIRMWWPMQDYFDLFSVRPPRFVLSLNPESAQALDMGIIPNEARAGLAIQGKPLSEKAVVKVQQPGGLWLVRDAGVEYEVRDEISSVNFYTYDFPEDYACKGLLGFFKWFKTRDFSRFCEGFANPQVRAGLFDIWWYRDYTKYAAAKNRSDLTLTTWVPGDKMRVYIRQDVAQQIWNYGVPPAAVESAKDPTQEKYVSLAADLMFDAMQGNDIPLNAPRSIAFAKDGGMYIADSRNHRVARLDPEGKVTAQWGKYADGVSVPIGPGTFNEPWGIAVSDDGFVYVTDTWNHRIEKFDADGRFIKSWGTFGQGAGPAEFYGPRGLAVDSKGRVYVTDTGNKRVVVFDADGEYLAQFGAPGFEPGQFDEPVGIAVDREGNVYVADTWNQRVQVFRPLETENMLTFLPYKQWDVYGWFGQSLDNKPFIAVNGDGHVFITDPDGFRVQEFDPEGGLIRAWGDFGSGPANFGLPSGIAFDPQGRLWVSDSVNHRVMRFTLP